MRFAHLKTHHRFERMRLRGLSGARDEFHLAAAEPQDPGKIHLVAETSRACHLRYLTGPTTKGSRCVGHGLSSAQITSHILPAADFFNSIDPKLPPWVNQAWTLA